MSLLHTVEGIGRHNAEREELEQREAEGRDEEAHGAKGEGDEGYRESEATAGRKGAGEWLTRAANAAEETMVRGNPGVCRAAQIRTLGRGHFVFVAFF